MASNFRKIINLIKQTGDRLIIYNENSDEAQVIMNLAEYERLIRDRGLKQDLTERGLIDKINRDIANWKSGQNLVETEEDFGQEGSFSSPFSSLKSDFKDREKSIDSTEPQKKQARWSIPGEIKKNAEEVIEEDRQYLEEVNY